MPTLAVARALDGREGGIGFRQRHCDTCFEVKLDYDLLQGLQGLQGLKSGEPGEALRMHLRRSRCSRKLTDSKAPPLHREGDLNR